MKRSLVYVGTYTEPIRFGTGQILDGKGDGIYLLELDHQSGELKHLETFSNVVNPSYLAINQSNGFLYAVNELKEFEGKPSGSVSSFAVSSDTGELKFVNKQPTGGTDPCHVIMDKSGSHLYVSNFMSGSVSVFPIKPDGSIDESTRLIQHEGSSVDPTRQTGPHAHSLVFSPDQEFAFVPDLGLDKLVIYKVNPQTKLLNEKTTAFFKTTPGAGPRHCVFDPDGDFCYLINELDSTILALAYNPVTGGFTELQNVSSLPGDNHVSGNSCADVHITPNGKYLYGSNRGHNSLVIFEVDQNTGMLGYINCVPCGGEIPRSFAIDPAGEFLLCANQDSDDIVVFRIDIGTGLLSEISKIHIPTPVCVLPVS